MAKVRFRGVKGARRGLQRDLRRLARAGNERSFEICEYIIDHIESSPFTPFDPRTSSNTTGDHLKFSYRIAPHPKGNGYLVVTKRRYWAFVEFGTRKMHAQPHVRPAVDAARARYGL
jgi:hypothetical protein